MQAETAVGLLYETLSRYAKHSSRYKSPNSSEQGSPHCSVASVATSDVSCASVAQQLWLSSTFWRHVMQVDNGIVSPSNRIEAGVLTMPPASPIRRAWYRWKSLRLPWRKKFLVGKYSELHQPSNYDQAHHFLGLDLNGNTYWEFYDVINSGQGRMRRMVQLPSNVPHSDASAAISPAWLQWLRHTRPQAPSLTEQAQDIQRQERMKVLAAQADAKWAAKPSFLDAPGKARGQPLPSMQLKDPGGYTREQAVEDGRAEAAPAQRSAVAGTDPGVGDSSPRTINGADPKTEQETQDTPDQPGKSFKKGERPYTQPKSGAEDPWAKARRPAGEAWQPQAWSPSSLAPKR
jgi:NADH dehydrogenase [ubiquinone] 1 alpha subcomplex assembly factor 2